MERTQTLTIIFFLHLKPHLKFDIRLKSQRALLRGGPQLSWRFYMLALSLNKRPGHVYIKVMTAILLDWTLLDLFEHGTSVKEMLSD